MDSNLLNQLIKNLENPRIKDALKKYLLESDSPELIDITEEIFSDPEKLEDFLQSKYKNKFNEISKKTPEHNERALIEMEQLLKNTTTKEKDMKKFFIKYPWFFGFEYIGIKPQKKIGEKRIPDYFLKHVNGCYHILEIKGPNDHIFNKKIRNNQFNLFFIKGLVQLMDYIDFCDQHPDYILSEHKINVYKPKGILLIDNNLNSDEKSQLRMFTSFVERISIKTYDEVYVAVKNAIEHAKK